MRVGHITIEVCIASPADATIASSGGADRVELNAALELGGLTPSLGTLIETRAATTLPIISMIRPRPGGFCYNDSAFRVMRRDIDAALEHGADGIAFGLLAADGNVDLHRCGEIVRQAGSHPVVFHRAFDFTPRPRDALQQLIDLGVTRIMTSGQRGTAVEGGALIRELIDGARGAIEILPAGGIRPSNARELVDATGCTQVHASLREPLDDGSTRARPQLDLGMKAATGQAQQFQATNPALVNQLVKSLRT